MWGITGRSARIGDTRRQARTLHAGLARVAVRGPVEHAVLELSGELDFGGAHDLVPMVEAMPHRIVSVDVAALEFVDAAGVRALEAVRDLLEARQGERPAIIGSSRAVERTLRLVANRMVAAGIR
jgi:anti-anti-sigma factor